MCDPSVWVAAILLSALGWVGHLQAQPQAEANVGVKAEARANAAAARANAAEARQSARQARQAAREARAAGRELRKEARAARQEYREALREARGNLREARANVRGAHREGLRAAAESLQKAAHAARVAGGQAAGAAAVAAHAAGQVDPAASRAARRAARRRAWLEIRTMARDEALKPRAVAPPLRREMKRHAWRVARLRRIRRLAAEKENAALVARVDGLLGREQVRHRRRLGVLVAVQGKGKVEVTSAPESADDTTTPGEE